MRDFQAHVAGVDQVGNRVVIVADDVAEDAAFNPFTQAEFAKRGTFCGLAFFVRFGDDFLPLGKVRQFFQQLRPVDLVEEYRHVAG